MIFSKVLCLMALFLTTSSLFAENHHPKVVVVGAGIAGLTTAYRLQQKGIDVQLYEARNRVGGRILTAKIGDKTAELGGQNIIDGGEAENLFALIRECGCEVTSHRISLQHAYFNEEEFIPIHKLLVDRFYQAEDLRNQLETVVQKAHNMRDVLERMFDNQDPLYKVLSVRLAAYEGAPLEQLSSCYAETLYHMLLGGISAAHPKQEENEIHFVSIQGGNALLTEKLAQKLGNRLHLNMPLRSIKKAVEGGYILTFQNEQEVKADILVLAIPCSVYSDIYLEEGIIPVEQLEAIKNVRYGTNAKILIPFSSPPAKRMTLLNDHMGCFFDAECHILTFYYTGQTSQFSADTILNTFQRDWSMVIKGYADQCLPLFIPEYARDTAFGVYEGAVGYSWPNDPYVKGSYSYIAPGQEMLLTSIQTIREERVKTLFAPIDQTLYFAGEHATILNEVPGTMEAACESGERAARMILKVLHL